MGFRFQRRIKIAPGISLNWSKSGVSTSFGPRGAKVTLGHGKVRTTAGVPGTGVSYTEVHSTQLNDRPDAGRSGTNKVWRGIAWFAVLVVLGWLISHL
jgi:hypothetical protein